MTEANFLETMQYDIIDCDEKLTMDVQLNELREWDSLAYVNFLVFAKSNGAHLSRTDISKAKTIQELWEMMK